jgi:hypothetical protein
MSQSTPPGGRLGNRQDEAGEAALLQLRPRRTALESENHGTLRIDSLTKLFHEAVWHSFVRNSCRSYSRSCAKGTLIPPPTWKAWRLEYDCAYQEVIIRKYSLSPHNIASFSD